MDGSRKVTPWRGGRRGSSYAEAGVSIQAGDRAVELLKPAIRKTRRPEVVGGIGGFAGLFALDVEKYRKPLLASSTAHALTWLLFKSKPQKA